MEDRYRRVRRLGRGAMGEVWLAEDTLLHRSVALKTLSSVLPASGGELPQMTREARLAARLNHPHAVAVYDLVVEDAKAYLVMEYVPGTTLAERIEQSGPLPLDDVVSIGIAVADALAEAHRMGIVHRDVKPANILLTDRGVPKLADFGIARDAELTATGFMGTPAFLAPETARGERATPASDVWSLGVSLYNAIDGQTPFDRPGSSALEVIGRVAMASTVPAPEHAGPMAPVISRMLAVDPLRRPSTQDVIEMLREIQRGAGRAPTAHDSTTVVPVLPPPPFHNETPALSTHPIASPPVRKRTGRTIGLAAAAAVVLGGGAVGIWAVTRDSGSPSPQTSSDGSSATHAGQAYTAPGGLSVRGPVGWTPEPAKPDSLLRDYVAPGAPRKQGVYFRLGIGNEQPAADIQAEAANALDLLRASPGFTDLNIVSTSYPKFLGTTAVQFEYTAVNNIGVPRHIVEQRWISNGETLEIVLNARSSLWQQYRPVFDQLLASASVSS